MNTTELSIEEGVEMSDDMACEMALLLSRGLDLCVRARKLDDPLEKLPLDHPKNDCNHEIIQTRCGTPHLWVLDQYDKDLEAWETESRNFLAKHGFTP